MIWIYLLLLVSGFALTVRSARRRSLHTVMAAAGTALAALAILGGFSIGIFVAPVAAVLLVVAGTRIPDRSRLA